MLSDAAFRGTCDAGEVCLGSDQDGFHCAPANFNGVSYGRSTYGACDECGRCYFACTLFAQVICPANCLYRVYYDDSTCADGPTYCFVTP